MLRVVVLLALLGDNPYFPLKEGGFWTY